MKRGMIVAAISFTFISPPEVIGFMLSFSA
jgi:hypothetical protein